ncbi:MAG: nitroreductase family protein [SAR202 cluster bacterium]|nr:nitroreductase family protein [SAR202 cluster bacterium]MDP7226191.1 nitroreductase family protein [SAR202 cluster bacterium]
MEVYEAIQTRLTVRQFKPDAVPDDVVMKLLRAGQWAPSSRNLQPWHFIVVRDRDMLKQIGAVATSGSFVADAPMAIAIAMDNADRAELDAGRALQQMELVAWDEGLGTCFVGLRVEEQNRKVKELLGIPEGMELITILPFGYRDEKLRRTRRPREALSGIAHDERFGQANPEG